MKLSLVIPCYNESKNLALLVNRCRAILVDNIEIILVDNGSTDDTPNKLQELLKNENQIRTVRVEKNKGYGFGILYGLKAAKGDVLAWTHADMQTDPNDALIGLTFFENISNIDTLFVKGKRYGRPIMDVFFTIGMSLFESILLRKSLWDINAQPTMFSKSFFNSWNNPPHDFSLDLYAYYMAKKRNLKIKRFKVKFGERAHGISHWNVSWSAKFKFIKRTIKFSIGLLKSTNEN